MSPDPSAEEERARRLCGVVQEIVVQTLDAEMKAVTGTDDPYPDSRAVTSRILAAIVLALDITDGTVNDAATFEDIARGTTVAADALSLLLRASRTEEPTEGAPERVWLLDHGPHVPWVVTEIPRTDHPGYIRADLATSAMQTEATMHQAWRGRAEEAESALALHGLRPLTVEEQAVLDAFTSEMQNVVIPEIVETMRTRAKLAIESRQWVIGGRMTQEAGKRAEVERLREALETLFPVAEGFTEAFDDLERMGLIVEVPADDAFREEWDVDTMYVWAWRVEPVGISQASLDADRASALRYLESRYGPLDGVGWDRLALYAHPTEENAR